MKIVIATDFSECAVAAEERALELARALGGEVVFAHVAVEAPLYSEGPFSGASVQSAFESQRRWAERALGERVAAAAKAGVPGPSPRSTRCSRRGPP